ncbi:MAG TPA: hypothetical protein PKA76_19620, partial [Pirellulaceae bacterium]|nr:hypothetical protein [Pirellulaceae bacterium]
RKLRRRGFLPYDRDTFPWLKVPVPLISPKTSGAVGLVMAFEGLFEWSKGSKEVVTVCYWEKVASEPN